MTVQKLGRALRGWAIISCVPMLVAAHPDPNQEALLGRIQRGDFVWSTDFLARDAHLFAYGEGLVDGLRQQCPALVLLTESLRPLSTVDKQTHRPGFITAGEGLLFLFSQTWELYTLGRVRGFRSPVGIVADSYRRDGVQDASSLVKSTGCGATETKHLAVNAMHMLAGERPSFGPKSSDLVIERSEIIDARNAYAESGTLLTPAASDIIYRNFQEFARMKFKILECQYRDSDPKYYDVQYYWVLNSMNIVTVGSELGGVLLAFQDTLQAANGSQRVVHPFLTYGSPRFECPAKLDAALPKRQIYAPRAAPRVEDSPKVARQPIVTESRSYRTYDYGAAPETFVPPIPAEIPQDKEMVIEMKKQQAGSLVKVVVTRFSWGLIPDLGRYMNNKVFAADADAVMRTRAYVLECYYEGEEYDTVRMYPFWYKIRPKEVDPGVLKAHIADHPILSIRGPAQTCPQNSQLAATAR